MRCFANSAFSTRILVAGSFILIVALPKPVLAVEDAGSLSASKSTCTTGFKSCAERDAWRAKQVAGLNSYPSETDPFAIEYFKYRDRVCPWEMSLKPGAPTPNMSIPDVDVCGGLAGSFLEFCEMKKFYRRFSKRFELDDQRKAFVLHAQKAVKTVAEARGRDLAAIKKFHTDNAIPPTLTMDQIKAASMEFSAHVRRASDSLVNQSVDKPNARLLKGYFDSYVADQIQTDAAKHPGFMDALEKSPTGVSLTLEQRYNLLFSRAGEPDSNNFLDGLTPYYARMLLMFHGANHLQVNSSADAQERLSDLAGELRLKVNADETTVAWENIIPHDGYVYGASPSQATHLLASATAKQSTGIDCSLLMQKGIEAFGYTSAMFDYRATTAEMMKPAAIERFANNRICSEMNLKMGQVVVHKGHTYIFAGYTGGSSPQMRIIEAAGGAHRTVRDAVLELYNNPDDDCRSSNFTNKGDPYFVLEPTKGIFQ